MTGVTSLFVDETIRLDNLVLYVCTSSVVISSVCAKLQYGFQPRTAEDFHGSHVAQNTSARPVSFCSRPLLLKWILIGYLDREVCKRLTCEWLNHCHSPISHCREKH